MTTNPPTLDLLRDAENYLSALHGSVARHDHLAANLGCAGCELRDKIREQLAAVRVVSPPPATRAALRDRIATAISKWHRDPEQPLYTQGAAAVLAVLPPPVDRAAVLREAADAIDAETRQAKADGVLEPDKYRPCRDASAQLRAMAGCQECASGLEHTEHCPTPETHNWGCGCPTDEMPAAARRMADEEQPAEEIIGHATLLELVRDFLDPDPCSFDHHGYCQAHAAGLGGEPMSCPHGRARKLLAAIDAEEQR